MTDMQGLCHIGSTVVYHDGLACADLFYAKVIFGTHGFQIVFQESTGKLQIDETGHNGFYHVVISGIQLGYDSVRDLDGGALILLGGRQSTVALVFAQVRPVGYGYPAKGCVIAGICKGLLHFGGDNI